MFHFLGNRRVLVDRHRDRCTIASLRHTVRILPRNRDRVRARRSTAAPASTASATAATACRSDNHAGQDGPEQQEAQQLLFARTSGTKTRTEQRQTRNR